MLWAILSDIHANLEALDQVQRDVDRRRVDGILCLGDVVGYGPQPRETLKRAFDYEFSLLGNHEEAAMYHAEDFNARARVALEWTRDQLNSKDSPAEENAALWNYIGKMPAQETRGDALFVHGSPRDPVREYMLPKDAHDSEKMAEVFSKIPARFCFVGHSHVPGVYTEDGRFLKPERAPDGFRPEDGKILVNVGSVGQPRDGDNRACYVTWDGELVRFHRVEYDYRITQQKILDTGVLPRYLAARLQDGR